MNTFLLRVQGGLDPRDSQAPVFVDLDRDAIEIDDRLPEGEEACRFRTSDGRDLPVHESVTLRCVDIVKSGYYGTLYVVEKV